MKNRVVIVDDQAAVRQMLALLLSDDGGYEVVGEGRTGLEGLALCERRKPGLLITELLLPEMSGTELVRRMRETHREMKILVFTSVQNPDLTLSALRTRPHGYVQKRDTIGTLKELSRRLAWLQLSHSLCNALAR
jgi:DNA-binding NarL/FixJ family response regulator